MGGREVRWWGILWGVLLEVGRVEGEGDRGIGACNLHGNSGVEYIFLS